MKTMRATTTLVRDRPRRSLGRGLARICLLTLGVICTLLVLPQLLDNAAGVDPCPDPNDAF